MDGRGGLGIRRLGERDRADGEAVRQVVERELEVRGVALVACLWARRTCVSVSQYAKEREGDKGQGGTYGVRELEGEGRLDGGSGRGLLDGVVARADLHGWCTGHGKLRMNDRLG